MTLPVGTVIRYIDYPNGDDGKIKPYWFIIMGRTSILDQPPHYLLFKTTTQLHYYQSGGSRYNCNAKLLNQSAYPIFDKDCYVDFDLAVFDRHTIPEIENLITSGQVEIKGRLDKIITELYHLSIKGKGASQKIKDHFHTSFNNDGITGLKKPQGHGRDHYRNKFSNH